MAFQSTKQFGHELGLSCCFRQWRAVHSHCSLLHGYAIAVKLVFEANDLDHCNWVQDFGGLKQVKSMLQDIFDHKLIVAEDDPQKDEICALAGIGVADVVVLPAVGCEKFAQHVYNMVRRWLNANQDWDRVRLHSVEIKEHGANSAVYIG